MKKIVLIFSLSAFLFCLNIAVGKGYDVEVRSTSPKLVEVKPGEIVTGSFLVSNNTEREEDFLHKLEHPAGWQVIVHPEIPFTLKAKDQQTRVVAFFVPSNFPAGRYQIIYSVKSQRDYGIADNDSFSVAVLPIVKLEILVEEKPEIVIAGDIYEVRLQLINRGNSQTEIKLKTTVIPDYPTKIEPSEIVLGAGKSRVLRLEVKTDEHLPRKIRQTLKIKAEAETPESGAFSSEKTVLIEIIPKGAGDFDFYHRLPSQIGLTGTATNGEGNLQFEYSGLGPLDEKGERSVNFLFRGPDSQDVNRYGRRDEYRLR